MVDDPWCLCLQTSGLSSLSTEHCRTCRERICVFVRWFVSLRPVCKIFSNSREVRLRHRYFPVITCTPLFATVPPAAIPCVAAVTSSLGLQHRAPGAIELGHRHLNSSFRCFAHIEECLPLWFSQLLPSFCNLDEPSSTHSEFHLTVVIVAGSTIKPDSHRCWPVMVSSPSWSLRPRPVCHSVGTLVPFSECVVEQVAVIRHRENIRVQHVVEALDPPFCISCR